MQILNIKSYSIREQQILYRQGIDGISRIIDNRIKEGRKPRFETLGRNFPKAKKLAKRMESYFRVN